MFGHLQMAVELKGVLFSKREHRGESIISVWLLSSGEKVLPLNKLLL